MRIVKCDLCGKECGNEVITGAHSMNLIPPDLSRSLRWDLCDNCARKLREYLRKEEKHEADNRTESHTHEVS